MPLDPMQTVKAYKQAPFRVGCLGCALTGWTAVAAIVLALLALIYYLTNHFTVAK